MALWGDVLKQAVKLLPELHRLLPLLDRITSPEAHEEQRKRALALAAMAEQARESAEAARQTVMEASRLNSQHTDLMARLEIYEQRLNDVAESQTTLLTKADSALIWLKTIVVLAFIMIGLLVTAIVVLKK
ncbi:MAG: hypothetical protein ABI383_13625 [Acidobacteriaceae bacterium]